MEQVMPEGPPIDTDGELPENIPPLIVGISLVYLVVLIVGITWCYFGDIPLLKTMDPIIIAGELLWSTAVGGLLVLLIGIVRWKTHVFDNLEGAVRSRLGNLTRKGVLYLSLFSSVAEELFFRGAIQTSLSRISDSPTLGLLITSILFGMLHMGRDRSYIPWTIFAVGSGLVLGYGFMLTGNILVPILIHFLINGVNMWRIIFGNPPETQP